MKHFWNSIYRKFDSFVHHNFSDGFSVGEMENAIKYLLQY